MAPAITNTGSFGNPPNEQLEFTGTFKENEKTGLGLMTYAQGGAFYHGHFQDGKRHGEGPSSTRTVTSTAGCGTRGRSMAREPMYTTQPSMRSLENGRMARLSLASGASRMVAITLVASRSRSLVAMAS